MRKLLDTSIVYRLGAGFGLTLVLTILIALIAVHAIARIEHDAVDLLAAPLEKERVVSDFATLIFGSVRRTTAIIKSSDPTLVEVFKDDAQWSIKQGDVHLRKMRELMTAPHESSQLALMLDKRAAYNRARDNAIKAKAGDRPQEAQRVFDAEFQPAARAFQEALRALVDMQRREIDLGVQRIKVTGNDRKRSVAALTSLAVLLGALCAWRIARSITRPIAHAADVARTVAAGDLRQNIQAGHLDETGMLLASLGRMNGDLAAIVAQVRGSAGSVASAAEEISAGNLHLSGRTEQQASALQETAASMEQLTAAVRQNAEQARQAGGVALDASRAADRSGAVMTDLVATMARIDASAARIADITGVIDGIAFQTNILALNAAVEAARAGEQGRGFAVVAAEVRGLAQRCAGAAREIKGLIGASLDSVRDGSGLVGQAGSANAELVQGIRRLAVMMAEVDDACREQSRGIEQVNQAIGQMDQVTQQNAALVEQAAAAAGEMAHQAGRLTGLVGVFKLAD